MSFPEPPPPSGPRGCPRCGCEFTTADDADPHFLLLALVNNTRCNKCGYAFNGKTGKSTALLLAVLIAVPILLAFGLLCFFLMARS